MTNADSVEYFQLNPDAFTRFFICKEILRKHYNDSPIKLLDVGGGSKYFRTALLHDKLPYELTVVDILPPPTKIIGHHYIQGDATRMDFADNSFNTVVSLDVLEHINDEKKAIFVQECYRVAKDLVVIAGPFDTPETTRSEKFANEFFLSLHGRDHPWLIEHFKQNKPTRKLIESQIKKFNCPYLKFESNFLPIWLKMILVNFVPETVIDQKDIRGLNKFFNDKLLSLSDFDSPGYRQFYLLYKDSSLKMEFHQYFKLEPSVESQLVLEKKLIELFVNQLVSRNADLHDEAQKLARAMGEIERATGESAQLTIELQDTAQHAENLQATIEDITNSRTYKLLSRLNDLRRKIAGN